MKYQASFCAKTCCLRAWKDHRWYGFIIIYWCLCKFVWERKHLSLEMQNFSSRVEKCFFHSFAALLEEKFYTPMRLVIITVAIIGPRNLLYFRTICITDALLYIICLSLDTITDFFYIRAIPTFMALYKEMCKTIQLVIKSVMIQKEQGSKFAQKQWVGGSGHK